MARMRYLKAEFFWDEKIGELPFEHRLLFQGLWVLADREGRLEDRPKIIKKDVFPYDSLDVDSMLEVLSRGGLIDRYSIEGKRYIQVKNFLKHQRPHKEEKSSKIPRMSNDGEPPSIDREPPFLKCESLPGELGNWGIGELGIKKHQVATKKNVTPDFEKLEEILEEPEIKTPEKALVPVEEPETLSQARELSAFFREKILERYPNHLLGKPGSRSAFEKWPIEIERMLRLDGRSPPDVREMIVWVTAHEFWAANILSASKLREKWDTLEAQRQRDGKNANKKAKSSTTRVFDESVAAIAEYRRSFKAERLRLEAERGQFLEGTPDADRSFPEFVGEAGDSFDSS